MYKNLGILLVWEYFKLFERLCVQVSNCPERKYADSKGSWDLGTGTLKIPRTNHFFGRYFHGMKNERKTHEKRMKSDFWRIFSAKDSSACKECSSSPRCIEVCTTTLFFDTIKRLYSLLIRSIKVITTSQLIKHPALNNTAIAMKIPLKILLFVILSKASMTAQSYRIPISSNN